MPSEPLKPEEVTIPLRTPECPFCHKVDVLSLTREEFRALNDGQPVDQALPTRSAPFREQVMSGIHPECWIENVASKDDDEKV